MFNEEKILSWRYQCILVSFSGEVYCEACCGGTKSLSCQFLLLYLAITIPLMLVILICNLSTHKAVKFLKGARLCLEKRVKTSTH